MSSKDTEKPKPRHRSDLKPGEINPYIPKYIVERPWYQQEGQGKGQDHSKANDTDDDNNDTNNEVKEDYLSHQRKRKEVIVDYSIPTSGNGIHDEFIVKDNAYIKKIDEYDDDNNNNNNKDKSSLTQINNNDNDKNIYDSKRDRWYGYNSKEWDKVYENWDKIKQKSKRNQTQTQTKDDESDDTDYELELFELGLDRKDIQINSKQDVSEKMIRDRQDIPSYIYNITTHPDNKIRVDYDPKSRLSKNLEKGFLNDKHQFVKKLSGEGKDLVNLQKFAWEIDQNDLKEKQTNQLINKLSGSNSNTDNDQIDDVSETNLDYSLEASPTLMMLKAKQKKEDEKKILLAKKQSLIDKYGNSSSTK
ncbi:pre-mRNA splicing factor affecting 3 splice site choice [Scheffersomyces amazonensis]|uniref:pre-mRNA splicing factor affecting 3 splice site choice n=1 Tax=Scheffersomyces amazonensis TaxID=1078765 RepID=UPI00315CF48D